MLCSDNESCLFEFCLNLYTGTLLGKSKEQDFAIWWDERDFEYGHDLPEDYEYGYS